MIQILYFGNDLIKHGKTPTSINFLGSALAEHFHVKSFSDKKNMLLRLLHMVIGLIGNARTARYAIIDTYSTFGFYYALIISQFANIIGVRYIPILHGGNLPIRFKKSPKFSKIFLENAHIIVVPSNYLKEHLENMGYNANFIPNLLDIKQFPYKERVHLRPKLLWVRSLKSIYNPKMAIRVLAELKKAHPNAELCMVGPTADASEIECRALGKELDINGELRLTGMLDKQELRRTAEDFDIFINTTNVDNTPLSVLEAMAMGLPVVSTNVGGIPFLLENDKEGLLTPPDDHLAMTACILRLMDDHELTQQLTANALKKVGNFDKAEVIQQWRAILK